MVNHESERDPTRVARQQGPPLWRSLEELAGDDSFQELLDREFPSLAVRWLDEPSRRTFLRLMGASLALSGIAGCGINPPDAIVPYVEQPEDIVPGRPLFFATAVPLNGLATGVLVESHTGRPIKIEGNPAHPASLGATDSFGQAAILSLYDPDRSQVLLNQGRVNTWERFLTQAVEIRQQAQRVKGRGLRLLTPSITSPTLLDQIRRLLEMFPEARWHSYEPVDDEAVREGARLAFGEELEPIYHFDRADVILSLEADFLSSGPGELRHARDYAARRGSAQDRDGAGPAAHRLYAVECTPSLTGAMADHRLAVSARDLLPFARAIARALKIEGVPEDGSGRVARHAAWISALVRDLEGHRGKSLVVAGIAQPPAVHALAHAINHTLGNLGQTITLHPARDRGPTGQIGSLPDLARDIDRGVVETLLILGANPAYDTPADLNFAAALASDKIKLLIHLGLYEDETAELCHWHIPEAHFLEAWGDIRAFDGTVTIQQPLIAPLYQGRSAHEVLAVFLGEPNRPVLDIVRDYWKRQLLPGDFEAAWQRALREGLIAGTATPAKSGTPKLQDLLPSPGSAPAAEGGGLELVFRPDPTIWDGRFANNGWLQELPKPLTRLTWGNAALISPARARQMGVAEGDVVELRYQGRSLRLPAWIMPGQAEETIAVTLGHGRWKAGRVGTGVGSNAYLLRISDSPWFGAGLDVVKTGERYPLPTVQHHHMMAGRELVRVGTVEEYRKNPGFAQESEASHSPGLSLYPEQPRGGEAENAWGMAIDLDRCIGCGACVVACQAENNIPIVGRDEVLRSREMHWLRIDRYYEGDEASDPNTYFQPILCMHCEKAPCEVVCPVEATTHSDEGLNEMTYNRCVGTRYCSNNCPYKVRRFNFFQYSDETTPSLKLHRNPDVTVRSRGVMEKCTYCVQRINHARINAKIEGRAVGGDEVVTACQAACPTRAIVFGNLADSQSTVSQLKASPRNYGLLTELNTRPRTTYLVRLRNPNPEIEAIREHRPEPNDDNTPA
jgi:molybdopterin-containing oxidoreductase family iron-sulfur binding subunit